MKVGRNLINLFMVMILLLPANTSMVKHITNTSINENNSTDWLTWNGNFQRTGYVSNSSVISTGRLNTKWKRFLGERIEVEVEPLVAGDLVFIPVMNGKLYALDRDSGDTRWVFNARSPITNTPSILKSDLVTTIYFGTISGDFFALDAANGTRIWQVQVAGAILSSPSIASGQILFGTTEGKFFSFESETGQLVWSFDARSPITSTSAILTQNNGTGFLVYFSSGDNIAYCLNNFGSLIWKNEMSGVFTKRNTIVVSHGVAIFTTRKAGGEYSEELTAPPEVLQGRIADPNTVISAWSEYYQEYPERRTLYFFNARSGEDLWQPDVTPNKFSPLYIPYWGLISPVVNNNGLAYFPASGSGGDHALNHDMRLWQLDLRTGEYVQAGSQDQFAPRFDEVGRPTLVGNVYYQTISEDIAAYDLITKRNNTNLYGNGFSNHRQPIEFAEISSDNLFGGLSDYFTRFGGSTQTGFAGAVDAISPVVVSGSDIFIISWGHVTALTNQSVTEKIDYGSADFAELPYKQMSPTAAKDELNKRVKTYLESGDMPTPGSRMWSWMKMDLGTYWHSGEWVSTLARTLPYLSEENKQDLVNFLREYIQAVLLNPDFYEYRRACLEFDTNGAVDPCELSSDRIQTSWYWNNPNLIAERLVALNDYAEFTGDWQTINQNWDFIAGQYENLEKSWNETAGYYVFEPWLAGIFLPDLQLAAISAIENMATNNNDEFTRNSATIKLNKMLQMRTYWLNYSSNTSENSVDGLAIDYFAGGRYNGTNRDFRQVYQIIHHDNGTLTGVYQFAGQDVYPIVLTGFHPIIPNSVMHTEPEYIEILSNSVQAIETYFPFWYIGDFSHASPIGGNEDDSLNPGLAADMFQAKAYILKVPYSELSRQLPLPYELNNKLDLFRVQNLTALLNATISVCKDRDGDYLGIEKFFIAR
jgi:outer membrane protein assembly factor BamB